MRALRIAIVQILKEENRPVTKLLGPILYMVRIIIIG